MALIDGNQVNNESLGLIKLKIDSQQGTITLETGTKLGMVDNPILDSDLANKSYVDEQVLTTINSEGLLITASSLDSGVSYNGTSTRTLSTMPQVFSLKINDANFYTNASTFNISGFGPKLLKDINGDSINLSGLNSLQIFSCYWDNILDEIRVLNYTNTNSIQTPVLSGNNYIISKNFSHLPSQINIRVTTTNPTTNPMLSLVVGGIVVLYDIVDQYALMLTAAVFEVGRVYSFMFNSTSNKFEVQGLGIGTGTGVTRLNTTVTSMSGTYNLDFTSYSLEEITATQTGPITFTTSGSSSFGYKWIKLLTTTGTPTFPIGSQKIGPDTLFQDGKINHIMVMYNFGKLNYLITQNSEDFISSGTSGTVTDPLMSVPNIGGYFDGYFTSSVNSSFFSIDELSTDGAIKFQQTTLALQPTYMSKNLVFSNNTKYLSPSANIQYSTKEFSIFVVVDDLWNGDKMILGQPTTSETDVIRLWYRNGTIQLKRGASLEYIWNTLPAVTGTKKILSIIGYLESSVYKIKLRINGVDHATIHTNGWGVGFVSGLSIIGNDLYVTNKGFVGNIGAMLRTNLTPSQQNITLIETTFAQRHNITL